MFDMFVLALCVAVAGKCEAPSLPDVRAACMICVAAAKYGWHMRCATFHVIVTRSHVNMSVVFVFAKAFVFYEVL